MNLYGCYVLQMQVLNLWFGIVVTYVCFVFFENVVIVTKHRVSLLTIVLVQQKYLLLRATVFDNIDEIWF